MTDTQQRPRMQVVGGGEHKPPAEHEDLYRVGWRDGNRYANTRAAELEQSRDTWEACAKEMAERATTWERRHRNLAWSSNLVVSVAVVMALIGWAAYFTQRGCQQ